MKIAIYSRKSKFTGKGESIENQIEMCKDYARKHFNHIDDIVVYEDEGFSGGNTKRPEFKRMIKDARKGRFDVLMCYRLDRISRNVADFSSTLETLQEHNISFVSIREQFDTSTPMGRAMTYIASVFAQLERETIAERIKDNMYQLARSGRWLGGRVPIGFKSEAIEYLDSEMNKKKMYKLSPVPEELKIVKQLFQKYLELNSLTQLTSWTIENNIKTKAGKYFNTSTLNVILANPVYCIADELIHKYFKKLGSDIAGNIREFDGIHGLMVFNKNDIKKSKVIKKHESKWIIAVGKHKGIINSSDWIQVQNMLKSNSIKAPRKGTGKYGLLSGLIRCADCGSTMRVSVSNKSYGFYYYYKCLMKERSRGSNCNIKNINGQMADDLVVKELKHMAMNNSALMKQLDKKKKEISKFSNTNSNKKKQLELQIHEYENSIKNLTMQLAKNEKSVAAEYIIKQIEELDSKIKELKKELYDIEEKVENSLLQQNNIEALKDMLKYFANNIDNLDFDEQKSLIRKIVNKVTWDGENLKIKVYGQE